MANHHKIGINFFIVLNNYHCVIMNYKLTTLHQGLEHYLLPYSLFHLWNQDMGTFLKYYLFIFSNPSFYIYCCFISCFSSSFTCIIIYFDPVFVSRFKGLNSCIFQKIYYCLDISFYLPIISILIISILFIKYDAWNNYMSRKRSTLDW